MLGSEWQGLRILIPVRREGGRVELHRRSDRRGVGRNRDRRGPVGDICISICMYKPIPIRE